MAAKGKISPQDSIQQVATTLPSQRSGDRSSLDGFSYQSPKRFNGSVESSQMGGGSYVDYRAEYVERLQQDIELTTRKLELEQRRHSRLTEDLKDAEVEFQAKRQRYKVLQTSQEDAVAEKAENVRRLERRLELAMAKFNAQNEHNETLRDQIDQLRKERQLLDAVFRKMSHGIRHSRRAIDEKNLLINEDKDAHDVDEQKVHALGKMLEKERRNFHKTTEELKKGIQEENEKATEQELLSRVGGQADSRRQPSNAPRRRAYMMADEEESFSETAMHRRILKICFLNTIQRRHIKQHHKNIEVFEQAFATIKSSTGISDIEEIEKIFIQLEQRNFSLLTYVNQLNREIESIEIRTRELANQLHNHKTEEQNSEARKSSALSEIHAQIGKTKGQMEKEEQSLDALNKNLEDCRPQIANIVRYLKSEIPELMNVGYEGDAPPMKVLPPDEHDSQLNHSLMYVEEAMLLFRMVLSTEPQRILPAKANQGTGTKKPSDLPSAHFTENDDGDDDEEAIDLKPWTRLELRDKAKKNIERRRKRPGQQGKLPHEERRNEFDGDGTGDATRRGDTKETSTGLLPTKETSTGGETPSNAMLAKSPSMVDKAGGYKEPASEEAGGRDEMWWRGQGREKKK